MLPDKVPKDHADVFHSSLEYAYTITFFKFFSQSYAHQNPENLAMPYKRAERNNGEETK